METLERCPICGAEEYREVFEGRDHVVSGEGFRIVECRACGFRMTNPRPDAEELGVYYEDEDYIPHSEEGRGLIDTAYHLVRKYTIRRKHRMALDASGGAPGRLMDYGCGTGEYLNLCRSKGWETEGIEPDEEARAFARETYDLDVHGLERIEEMPEGHFDVITLWHVLEHIPDLHEAVENLKRVLAKEGALLVAVPNWRSLDATIYGKGWAAYDVPRHLYHFRPTDVEALFSGFGMKVTRKHPLAFDAFYVSMLSEKYKDGFIPNGAVVGLVSNMYAFFSEDSFSTYAYVIEEK